MQSPAICKANGVQIPLLTSKNARVITTVLIRMFVFCRGDSRIARKNIRNANGRFTNRPLKCAKQKRAIHESPLQTNFGRDVVSSADLWYNGANEKPPSEREVARHSRDGRSLRDFRCVLTLS